MNGAIVRIILRYGAGGLFGSAVGNAMLTDPDVQMVLTAVVAVGIAVVTEWFYALAKSRGWDL